MNFIRKHFILSSLIFIILLAPLFIVGETSIRKVAKYISPPITQTAAVVDFDNTLVVHYTFDDGSVSGAPVGNAKNFNGTNDKVTVLNDVISTNTITVCAWIYPTAVDGPHAVVSNSRFTFGTYLTNGRLHLTSTQNNGFFSTTNAIRANQWYHVCGIRNAGTNGPGSIYINGVLNSSGNTGTPVSGYGLAIGNDQSNTYPWSGNLDDVRIYNRALSVDEITQLYEFGSSSVVTTPPPTGQEPSSPPPSPAPTSDTPPTVPTTPDQPSLSNITTATSCSLADVQYAVDHTSTGGTVFIPAGNCGYSDSVQIPDSKRIRIIGAGVGSTILQKDNRGTIFYLGKSGSRVTGFTFILGHQDANGVQVDGTGWRIDHNRFQSVRAYPSAIWVREETSGVRAYGVTDHNDFVDVVGVLVAPGNIMNNTSWAENLELGTERATYIEDSTFTYTRFAEAMDSNYGARLVFRHNVVKDTIIGVHSVQGLIHRAARSWEFYDNTFINTSASENNFIFQIRGGTGVIFNNTIVGKWRNPIIFDNVRDFDSRFTSSTKCGGASPWDGNQPVESGGQGTHNGASAAAMLSDTTQQWPVNGFVAYTAGEGTWNTHWVWNLTDGSKGLITGNSGTIVTATLSGGVRNTWNPGDTYKISNGYPCRDQIGRSKDQWLWTNVNPYPPQQLEPVYLWNNRIAGIEAKVSASPIHIKAGRDYIVGTPRPGYVPYAYPHPLTVSGFTSDDPNSVYVPPTSSPTCTSFTYSPWGICTNGTQSRTKTSSSPTGCTGGTPEQLTQSCTTTSTPGDFDSNGKVNALDFSALSSHWNQIGPSGPSATPYDLNKDGIVNSLDFSIMATHWTG